MEFEEAKEKILGFLDKKTEFSTDQQYFLLRDVCDDLKEECLSGLSTLEEEEDDFDDGFSEGNDAAEDDAIPEPVAQPKTVAPTRTRLPPKIKKPVVKIEDMDDDI